MDKNGRVTSLEQYQIEKTRYGSRAEMKDAPGNRAPGRGFEAERDINEMLRDQQVKVEYREGRQRWSPEFGLILPGDPEAGRSRPEKSPPIAIPGKDREVRSRPEKTAPQRPEKLQETPRDARREPTHEWGLRYRDRMSLRETRAPSRPPPPPAQVSAPDDEGYWTHGGRNLVMGAAAVGVGVMSTVLLAGASPAVGAGAVTLAVVEGLSAGLGLASGITAIGVGLGQVGSLAAGRPTNASELNTGVELVLNLGSTFGLAGGVIAQVSGVPIEKGAKIGDDIEKFAMFNKTVFLSNDLSRYERDAELSKTILDVVKDSAEKAGKKE